jgi:hypothetical protein
MMKWMKFLFIAVIGIGLMTALPSCEKENELATCDDGILNGNETGIDCGGDCPPCISCNDGVQNGNETGIDCGGDCPHCISCNDGIQNGNETDIDCGGDCPPCISCNDGIQNGNETDIDCGGDCPPCIIGLEGNWWSRGTDVAPLLVTLFAIDSIYAEFRPNLTYTIIPYSGGVPSTLAGVYIQSESGVGAIWNVTLNQNSPSALTSVGIFQVTGNNMTYEVIQTDVGAIPPTAAAGFGSTSGGSLGMLNVQKYLRAN